MKRKLVDELIESLEEAIAHQRGEIDLPADQIHFVGQPDPREIRARLEMTQEEFAGALAISVATLRNWEQGRRRPTGPALRLLKLAEDNPEILRNAAA